MKMGKPTKKTNPATEQHGQHDEENNPQGANASQKTTFAANTNEAPLTKADMEAMLLSLEERIIAKLSSQLSADRALIEQHDQTIQQMETSMNDMQNRMIAVEATCSRLTKENETLKMKADELENRSRRNNIRITGLPEKAEGPRPTTFLTECLKEIFGPDAFTAPLMVDRAHRINIQRRNLHSPRPFIARIHHYQNKERILQLARESNRLIYRGAEVHIFPDYSPEVSRKRAAFADVKSQLRGAGYPYRMFFPARLQIMDKSGQKTTFTTPEEVQSFLRHMDNGK